MNPLLGVLILVLLGLIGARSTFSLSRAPLGPRLFITSGTHFIVLGMLLGSSGLALLTPGVLEQLYPFLALGLGWIGLLFGLQLDRRQLAQFPASFLMAAVVQAVLALFIFLAIGSAVLDATYGTGPQVRLLLLVAAATASVSTPSGIALIKRTYLVKGRLSTLIFFIASLDALVGIVALQIAYAFHHPDIFAGGAVALGGVEWFLMAVAAGIVFGVFFLWLTRPKPEREELALFLLGLVVFAAGTGLYLGISPIFVATAVGAIVANLSPSRRRVYTLLQAWERPVYVILLILAGALLQFSGWVILPLALLYLLLRAGSKVVGGYVATRLPGVREFAPPSTGTGLVPHGGISLAMAVSVPLTYGVLEQGGVPLGDIYFGTVVLGIMGSDLVGPFLTRDLLRRAGEISPRVEHDLARQS